MDTNTRCDERAHEQRDRGAAASYAPDKLFADGAEGRLREEGSAELVALHHVYFGLLDGASPLVERKHAVPLLLGLWVHTSLTSSIWNTSDSG